MKKEQVIEQKSDIFFGTRAIAYQGSYCAKCGKKVRNIDKMFWLEPAAIYVDENGCDVYHKQCLTENIFEIDKGGVIKFPRLWSEEKKEWEAKNG